MLKAYVETGEPPLFHGQSEHGGAHGTLLSLQHRGFLTWGDIKITEAGRKALKEQSRT